MGIRNVKIGQHVIGQEQPVIVAAEIGTFFDHDMELARTYIDQVKNTGAHFLKTEILHDISVIHDNQLTHTYLTDNGTVVENYKALIQRKIVSLKEYEKLFAYARSIGLPIMASVYDFAGVDFLVSMKAEAVKIASPNIINKPLIEYCASKGFPLLFDTGNALLHEVASAVEWAENKGASGIILNHRPDGHPCPAREHHMRTIECYLESFNWPVGLSCHYDGDEMIYLAIGMGARFIEKPLFHKKKRDDQDTMFTMQMTEFKEMVRKVGNCYEALGKRYRKKQAEYGLLCRPCLVASKDIPQGETISTTNITFAFPMKGIVANLWEQVQGKKTNKPLQKGTPIQYIDLAG